ncbi:hypothetical protein ABES02_29725 [Neobacillus pocheonensis]|uniref:hypothetical protein n=1 Tax=Neobacillus pocheonensis TaxID=363869 RepID=UPI003D2AC389
MITSEVISKYAKLVDRNCHGEVLEEIAKDLKVTYYADIFKCINVIHEKEGSLSHDVHGVRERIRQEFKKHLKQELTEGDYKAIARYV